MLAHVSNGCTRRNSQLHFRVSSRVSTRGVVCAQNLVIIVLEPEFLCHWVSSLVRSCATIQDGKSYLDQGIQDQPAVTT